MNIAEQPTTIYNQTTYAGNPNNYQITLANCYQLTNKAEELRLTMGFRKCESNYSSGKYKLSMCQAPALCKEWIMEKGEGEIILEVTQFILSLPVKQKLNIRNFSVYFLHWYIITFKSWDI